MPLEREVAVYKRLLPTLQAEEGKYALIHADDLVGVFGTYQDALAEGYKSFKLEPFLVQQIRAVEQIHLITRFIHAPCRI